MFKHLTGLIFALFLMATLHAAEPARLTQIETPDSILFVGNSFTFYNNAIYTHLRKLLMAEDPSSRQRIFLKSMTISGAVLADHRGGLGQMLASRSWDVIVLQGHSRAVIEPERETQFRTTVQNFSAAIRAEGATPVLFMTWAYADRPDMTAELARSFIKIGNELDILVVPAGLAFERARKEIPGVTLHNEDLIHPSLEGTYLAAAVFYSALYGKSPVVLEYSAGLDDGLARKLRQAAWDTVKQYYLKNPSS